MVDKKSKYPALTIKDGKVYLDGNKIRAVTNYSIFRSDARKANAILHLTVLIDPNLSINDPGENIGCNILDKVQGETPDFGND